MQGLNRQIRRMCEYFGYEVTKLERTRIMNVSLSGIPLGEWRDLTDDELIELFKLIENSSSEAKPKAKAKPKTQAIKRPVVKAPHGKEKGRGKPGNGKRFTQPGRKERALISAFHGLMYWRTRKRSPLHPAYKPALFFSLRAFSPQPHVAPSAYRCTLFLT